MILFSNHPKVIKTMHKWNLQIKSDIIMKIKMMIVYVGKLENTLIMFIKILLVNVRLNLCFDRFMLYVQVSISHSLFSFAFYLLLFVIYSFKCCDQTLHVYKLSYMI